MNTALDNFLFDHRCRQDERLMILRAENKWIRLQLRQPPRPLTPAQRLVRSVAPDKRKLLVRAKVLGFPVSHLTQTVTA